MLEKIFKLKENNTTVKTEIMAGVTTFLAMCYILIVNASMFENIKGVSFGAVYIGTAITTIIGCILIGFFTNLPIAQSTGMGVNAFFVFTCCLSFGFSYANALVFIFVDGLLFLFLTVTGLRSLIFESIPKSINTAIPVGIGLFIAFIGLQNAKIIIPDESTCVNIASFNFFAYDAWPNVMAFLVTLFTLILMATLMKRKIHTGIFWAVLAGSILYYVLGFTVKGFYETNNVHPLNLFGAFKDFCNISFCQVFREGFDFSYYFSQGHSVVSLFVTFVSTCLAFCMLSMFDSLGTLFGCCKAGNLFVLNEKKEPVVPKLQNAMSCDAIATIIGSVCGTSTQTIYMESTAGIGVGGKTGMTAVVVGLLFLIALFFVPIAYLVPPCAYSAALIYVGLLMMGGGAEIDWQDPEIAFPAFITVIMIPFTYNVSFGIAFGLLTYVLIKLFLGKIKEIKFATWILFVLFVLLLFFTH